MAQGLTYIHLLYIAVFYLHCLRLLGLRGFLQVFHQNEAVHGRYGAL